MPISGTITIDVQVADQATPLDVAEAVFDFLVSDPDDLFPAIEVVEGFNWEDAE